MTDEEEIVFINEDDVSKLLYLVKKELETDSSYSVLFDKLCDIAMMEGQDD